VVRDWWGETVASDQLPVKKKPTHFLKLKEDKEG